jgi:hypothetical protein
MKVSRFTPSRTAVTTGVVLALAGGLALVPLVSATAQPVAAATRCASEAGKPHVKQIDTASYRMILSVGAPEDMYTQVQVNAKGITAGELMLAGRMNSSMDMGMGGGLKQHVEVSICNLSTGKVMRGAKVHMSLARQGGTWMPMNVAEMRGLDEPRTMSHYGNNVRTPKSPYKVKVRAGGQTAVFHVA